MNIFYFNINYTCNSNCVFCYSHNTIHTGHRFNEIEPEDFVDYLRQNRIQETDRVIINGGEPFLHSKIIEILKSLLEFGCEVLIYTNGRCLKDYDFNFITNNYRFIIPVHGHKKLHDNITRCQGSYEEMNKGIKHLNKYHCKVDIKIILNPQMVSSIIDFEKTLKEIDSLDYNNAVHITKMADTIVSRKNGIPSVSNDMASTYTNLLFKHFSYKGTIVKIFDTCVKDIEVFDYENVIVPLKVHFKDSVTSWIFTQYTPDMECRAGCSKKLYCKSAVGNFTVLEYNGRFYQGIE